MSYAPFCAVCTEESSTLTKQPIGRGGALVWVCNACDDLHPRSGRYSFEGGKPTTVAAGDSLRAFEDTRRPYGSKGRVRR